MTLNDFFIGLAVLLALAAVIFYLVMKKGWDDRQEQLRIDAANRPSDRKVQTKAY